MIDVNPNNCLNQTAWELWGLRNGLSFARFVHDTIDLALAQFHAARGPYTLPISPDGFGDDVCPEPYLLGTILDPALPPAAAAPLPAHLVPQRGPPVIYARPNDENQTFARRPRRSTGVRAAYFLMPDDENNAHAPPQNEPMSLPLPVPRALPLLPERLDFGQPPWRGQWEEGGRSGGVGTI